MKKRTSCKALALSTIVLAALSLGTVAHAAKQTAVETTANAIKSTKSVGALGSMQDPATTATHMIDVTGIDSAGYFLGAGNTVMNIFVGANTEILGLGFDVRLEAYTPSWLSEIRVTLTDSDISTGVHVKPGVGADYAGVANFSGSADFVRDGISFAVGADGMLRIEFNESFDDGGVNPDGRWLSGYLTVLTNVTAVPEPSTYGLMALGLIGVGFVARRRTTA